MGDRRIRVVALTAAIAAIVAIPAPLAVTVSQAAATSPSAVVDAVTGEFVWHDLVTANPAASRTFYASLFGWTFEDAEGVDPGYVIIKEAGRPIGGIVTRRNRDGESFVAQWLAYVRVDDVDRAAAMFRTAGGRIIRGPLTARKDLRVAAVADPQGAPLGLASRGPRLEPETRPAPVNRWLWMEYVARDPDAALKFYGDVVGYRHELSESRENFTYYLLTADRPRAGLFRSPWERDTSAWLPYVRVADPSAMAARATQLGGRVVLEPAARVRNGSLAIVVDPAGAPLALQKFPFDGGVTP